jgi:rubrerythrin
MAQRKSKHEGILELLCQALETELGGAKIYEAALKCATDDDLHREWEKYHKETLHHQEVLRGVFDSLGLDPDTQTPGRSGVAALGQSLVDTIEGAKKHAEPAAAQIVAAECVVLAETKDHLNWELIGYAADQLTGDAAKVLKAAHDEVEVDEDHHLYHTRGWAREMWIASMGFKAVLPPPEEVKKVESAAEAARAEHARGKMM